MSRERGIGSLASFAIVAGSMLGIGIFLAPSEVAKHLSSPALFLGMWAFGGLVSLAGAVACAELGALFPEAGGDYVFQHKAFGSSVAFASGWVLFAAIFCGSIATMSVGICSFQLPALLGFDPGKVLVTLPLLGAVTQAQLGGIGIVAITTGLNLLGAKPPSVTQIVFTLVPLSFLLLLAGYALMGSPTLVEGEAAQGAASSSFTSWGALQAFLAVYFAYSGWINIIYVAGEVRAPERNIPRALIFGTGAITLLYLALCFAFLKIIGITGLREVGDAGAAIADALLGPLGKLLLTSLVALALLASINATILAGARVALAMAGRNAAPSALGRLNSRQVPARALLLQAAISIILIVSGRFEQLLSMVSVAMVLTGSLTVLSLFVLRHRMPDLSRPYRASAYPWLPALYLFSCGAVIIALLVEAVGGRSGAWYPLLGLGSWLIVFLGHKFSMVRKPGQ